MLMHTAKKPFDGPEWLFELKLDGARCVAFCGGGTTVLKNKRDKDISAVFPEVEISAQVNGNAVLDGELIVITNGVPDFYRLVTRALKADPFSISIASKGTPACFVAFDILYLNGKNLCGVPLLERKAILADTVAQGGALSVSRHIEQRGIDYFNAACSRNLEGLIAKRRESIYRPGKRTREWLKIKNPRFPETRNEV